jgi:hypothetical protein
LNTWFRHGTFAAAVAGNDAQTASASTSGSHFIVTMFPNTREDPPVKR